MSNVRNSGMGNPVPTDAGLAGIPVVDMPARPVDPGYNVGPDPAVRSLCERAGIECVGLSGVIASIRAVCRLFPHWDREQVVFLVAWTHAQPRGYIRGKWNEMARLGTLADTADHFSRGRGVV
jgi:hypothetical protein